MALQLLSGSKSTSTLEYLRMITLRWRSASLVIQLARIAMIRKFSVFKLFKWMQVIWLSGYPRIFSIFTHLTKQERLLLLNLSRNLSGNPVIVEVGSYLGASACFLATGARLKRGKVYAVDTWTNIAMSDEPRDTYDEFISNTKPLENWIVPLRGLSTELASRFHEEIDLLFIDGDHSYKAVHADLEAWLPKLKDGGIVAFHDYNWAEGVRRAVQELVVPLQVEGGHRLESIYWTRISHKNKHR
jgi:predicted O-methyltransferase YrrM